MCKSSSNKHTTCQRQNSSAFFWILSRNDLCLWYHHAGMMCWKSARTAESLPNIDSFQIFFSCIYLQLSIYFFAKCTFLLSDFIIPPDISQKHHAKKHTIPKFFIAGRLTHMQIQMSLRHVRRLEDIAYIQIQIRREDNRNLLRIIVVSLQLIQFATGGEVRGLLLRTLKETQKIASRLLHNLKWRRNRQRRTHCRTFPLDTVATSGIRFYQVWFLFPNFAYKIFKIFFFSTANLILLSQGFSFGWIAPVLPLWMSEDTPLTSGPMSTEEISWVVSIRSLGTLSAAFVFHSIVVRLGCKRTMTSCLAILSIVSLVSIQKYETFSNWYFLCRFLGYYMHLVEQNMKFWFHDSSLE